MSEPMPQAIRAVLAGAILLPLVAMAEESSVYIQSGDIRADRATVWARCNREADSRLVIRIRDLARPQQAPQVRIGPRVTADSDYTASVTLRGLRPNREYAYQVECLSRFRAQRPFADRSATGRFRTAPRRDDAAAVRFVWAADLAGQGWGRNPELQITSLDGDPVQGGYVVFDSMRRLNPDFALFSGDMIYADNRIAATQAIPDALGGGIWVNDPTKDFVAVSLDDFRANWLYNLGDGHLGAFLRTTPVYVQWDDHEVANNWYPGETLTAEPYNGLSADVVAAASRQALFEYNPIEGERIFRSFGYGRHLDLFLLDERSFRGPNPENSNPAGIEMLGQEQFAWLKDALQNSRATWKVIATHDPLSIVTGGEDDRDAWAQGDAAVLGREVQLAELLRFIRDEQIRNVVYLTADVHYAAAIQYDPARAEFQEYDPFWEFVIGPIHAGAFGAGELDASFGPEYVYLRAPSTEGFDIVNLPPPNLQSFGAVEIDARGELTVRIHDIDGAVLYEQTLSPQ